MSSVIKKLPGRSKGKEALNAQQLMALHALLADKSFNCVEACRKAGYKSPASVANKLMTNAVFVGQIGRALRNRIERTKVTQDRVIHELAAIAFSNIQDLLKDDDSLRKLSSLDEKVARSVSSIKVQYRTEFEDGQPVKIAVKEIKFWPKVEALSLLAKHLGMITEKHEIRGEVKLQLDYEALYHQRPKGEELDRIEAMIQDPTQHERETLDVEKANYSVKELVEENDDEER